MEPAVIESSHKVCLMTRIPSSGFFRCLFVILTLLFSSHLQVVSSLRQHILSEETKSDHTEEGVLVNATEWNARAT